MQGCEEGEEESVSESKLPSSIHPRPSKANESVESEGSTARINNRTSQFKARKIGKIIIESEWKIKGWRGKLRIKS
jgi:hypothetical protein